MSQKFIKCFSLDDCEKLKQEGLELLFSENGQYWFTLNDNIKFSNSQDIKYEITDVMHM